MRDPRYGVITITDEPAGWFSFRLLTGFDETGRRSRLGWNGSRFARGAALAVAARRAPYELEALTAWLEAGRP